MAEAYEEHRYLYHYTTLAGLENILDTQTLWATHYKALNDFSEILHMRGLLEREIYTTVNRIMRQDANTSLKYKLFLKKHGGLVKASKDEAKNIVEIFYNTTFGMSIHEEPFAAPYVVSFCAHTNHGKYVQDNGLLSMWRAYGNEGGYALVFDAKRLRKCLESEERRFAYSGFYLAKVIYDDAGGDVFDKEFSELREVFRNFIMAQAKGIKDATTGEVFFPLFNTVTRFKHQGFKEESEVRLAAAPIPKGIFEKAEPEKFNRKLKPILVRNKRGKESPYIILNDVPKRSPLPILKIVVGPQQDQTARLKDVRALIGKKRIKVFGSNTPYIPV